MLLSGIFSQEHLCCHFHFIQGSIQRPLFQGTLPPTPELLMVGRLRKRKNFPHENMNYFFMICQEVSCNCGRTYLFYSLHIYSVISPSKPAQTPSHMDTYTLCPLHVVPHELLFLLDSRCSSIKVGDTGQVGAEETENILKHP